MKCTACGALVASPQARFCWWCGAAVAPSQPVSPQPAQPGIQQAAFVARQVAQNPQVRSSLRTLRRSLKDLGHTFDLN